MVLKGGSVSLPIIISTDSTKPNPDTRKFIRSHVMLGKNRGRFRRSGPEELTDFERDKCRNERNRALQKRSTRLVEKPHPIIPKRVGSDASLLQFADSIEPLLAANILRFGTMSKKVLFALERCIDFNKKEQWHDLLIVDPVYLHAMAFITQYFFDGLTSQQLTNSTNRPTSPHFVKTLQLLRVRLSLPDEQVKPSIATIMVVLFLAIHAHITGNIEFARHHLNGLYKLVNLRGGVTKFTDDVKLRTEIYRCDLSVAVRCCTSPLFFDALLVDMIPYPLIIDSARFLEDTDATLARTWDTMKGFCLLVNTATATQQRLPIEILSETMTLVMYRLLLMEFEPGSIAEAIRLGLLAFSSHVFLQWQGVQWSYDQLSIIYKNCLLSLKSLNGISSHIMLWLLMVGEISVFRQCDDQWLKRWLRANIQLCNINSWSEMRDIMESFMWVDVLYDQAGKDVFESTLSPLSPEVYHTDL
ncbi:uncharacterized protein BDW43DRAFT_266653 [Aspergillus alliaceus]|uniref:uncharacterized protein n=1 Tax=Petromyces alliaceus TaxID=209559 RepID=UPI0012A5E552|nr:uncharacterized protein BDW43DRAFT_266653 [Aspergillus alliaceus]KAB8236997.1 hypothetical protein BDW43DRAFT_266653 [Aspergillus alliaceus]